MGAVVMVLSLEHQLSEQGYYWFSLPRARVSLPALVEHTNFVSPEHFEATTSCTLGIILCRDTNIFH